MAHLKNKVSSLFVLSLMMVLLAMSACSKSSQTPDRNRVVNFLPDSHIDSLYLDYTKAEGIKRISLANNLLSAIYEEETADSLIQFSNRDNAEAMDATVNYWMGEYLCYSCRFPEAEAVSHLAMDRAVELGDTALQSELNSLLGLVCQRMGKNEEALKYMQKCYEASSRSGNLEDQSSDLGNLAALSLALQDPKLA